MNKNVLLIRSNVRRARGQTAAILVLVLLSSMLLNIWLMLALDYKQNFKRCHDKLNAEHVTALFDNDGEEIKSFLAKTVEGDKRTAAYRIDDALCLDGSIDYSGGSLTTDFFALEKETAVSRDIGKCEIVEDGDYKTGVYLPMLYGKGQNYKVGDTLKLRLRNHTLSYTVCGFFNNVMTGSHNCGMCMLIFTRDAYRELKQRDFVNDSMLLSVRLKDKSADEDFEAMIKNAVSVNFPSVIGKSNSYTLVSSSRYISQMICAGIVSAMAFFIILIALVVIASNTANYIQENMRSLGVLKAVGYTGRQLRRILLWQFLSLTLFSCAAGNALSYGLFPALNEMMISQTGIPYEVRFLPVPLIITFAVLCGTVSFTVWLSSRRIKQTEPIAALRQGVRTHNFKRNPVPLWSARTPLNVSLALKTTFSGKKQNIVIGITMLVLSLIVVFSSMMTKNVIMDKRPMVDLIVGEVADSGITVTTDYESEFLEAMNRDDRVEKLYLYHAIEVRHVGHIALSAIVLDDYTKLNNQKLCTEGRFPKYDNEMLIAAKYAKEQGLKIGDEITLTADGNEAKYILCGFTQVSNYLGKDCLMLRSGYERMGKLLYASYCFNIAEGVDIDAFNEEISERFSDSVIYAVNIEEEIEALASVYVSVIQVIVVAVVILSIVVIAFVLFLLVRTLLLQKKHDYGIQKALGFTTGQLILQTAISFMPAVIFSTAIGLMISVAVINPLTALFLRGIGIVKCAFEIPMGAVMAAGAAIVLLAFGFACLLSFKIRKIAPRALLSNA